MISIKSFRNSLLKPTLKLIVLSLIVCVGQSVAGQADSLKLNKNINETLDSSAVNQLQDSVKLAAPKVNTDQRSDEKDIKTTQDSVKVAKENSKPGIRSIFKGKPGKAFALSLVLPGAGQLYNQQDWKVPIAIAIEGFTIYNIINSRKEFNLFDESWRYALDNPTLGPFTINNIPYTSATQINTTRVSARKNMEYAWLYWGVARLFVGIEAFVDRHLIDFDISDDLSIKMEPAASFNLYGQASAIPSLSFTWSLN